MKIVLNRIKTANAISPIMATALNRSTIPAVEGILIEAKKPNICVFTTYDLEKGMRIKIEADVIEEGYYIINAQKFIQTLRVMESDEITLTVDNRMIAKIVSGTSTFSLNALDGEDFPEVPSLKSEMSFFLKEGLFKRMLSKISYAMGTVDLRQVLNGCFVHVEDEEMLIVSCDTIKLAKCYRREHIQTGNENDTYIRYSFILPVKTVAELYKLLSDDDESTIKVYLMRKHIVFEIGDIVFFSRLIEGEYIDYDRVILTNHKIFATVDKDVLLNALDRASLITEEKITGSVPSNVKLTIEDGILKISAISKNGSSYDEIPVEQEGDNITIAFRNKYLIDSIRSCDTDKIKISLSSPLTSVNIEPVDGDEANNEIYMLLPVRMKD